MPRLRRGDNDLQTKCPFIAADYDIEANYPYTACENTGTVYC